jgi:hypothetical protein
MPILDKMTTLQLNKIKQELEDELRTIAPAVIAQLDLIENILRSRESSSWTLFCMHDGC